MSETEPIQKSRTKETDALAGEIGSDLENGLSPESADRKLKAHVRNRISEMEQKSVWEIIRDQMKTPVVFLLAAAAALSFVMGDFPEGAATTKISL